MKLETVPNQNGSKTIRPQGKERFDAIVAGAGPSGIATALNLSLQGLDVLVLDKGDVGTGTAAKSTRLAHGGLRYLKSLEEAIDEIRKLLSWQNISQSPRQMLRGMVKNITDSDVPLVKEALHERQIMLHNAPHLVHPLPFIIPVYESPKPQKAAKSAPTKKPLKYDPLWKVAVGVKLYDQLTPGNSFLGFIYPNRNALPASNIYMTKWGFQRNFTDINRQGLKGGITYWDAQIVYPERLCLENAIAAKETGHAEVRTHSEVDEILKEPCADNGKQCHIDPADPNHKAKAKAANHVSGVAFTDLLNNERYEAKADVVINATGPWVDELAGTVLTDPMQMLGGTKGTHIVTKWFPGAPTAALYVQDNETGRPFFIVPWLKTIGENGLPILEETRYLIGTTDTEYTASLDEVVPSQEEVDYLLRQVNRVIPTAQLQNADVLFKYSGIRPLVNDERDPAKKSRRHYVADHGLEKPYAEYPGKVKPGKTLPGLLSLVGGKLTVHRSLADEAAQVAIQRYGLSPTASVDTAQFVLPGAQGIVEKNKTPAWQQFNQFRKENIETAVAEYGISKPTARNLIDLYGIRYRGVLDLSRNDKKLLQPIGNGPRIQAQVYYAIQNEFARTVPDILNRLGATWTDDNGLSELDAIADTAIRFGWPEDKVRREVNQYKQQVSQVYQNLKGETAPVTA